MASAPARSKWADGAHDVDRVAVPGVGVDDQVGIDAFADQRQGIDDFGHGHEADVGPSEPSIGDRGAGDVERREACFGCHQRRERVIDAGRHHDGLMGQTGA